MLVIIDLLVKLICNINLISFIIFLNYIDIKEFIISLLIFALFNRNVIYILVLLLIYILEKILKKYINYNLIFRLSLVTFYYAILFEIDASYLINILLVIIIDLYKYNSNGDRLGIKKVCK